MACAKAPGTCGLIAALLLCLLAGLGVLAAPEARAEAAATAPDDARGLRIGLEDAAFKDFLVFMGQFSGKNPVFREDQLPDATVTLVSRQGVSAAELAEMQSLVLAVAGLSAIPRGEVVYLLPDSRRPVQPAGPTQILALRFGQGLATGQVVQVLEGLRSDIGQVAAAKQGRWVVIRDRAERVQRARAVHTALEAAPAGAELDLAPLGRAEAALAARKLDMHFRGLPGPAPVVLALEWSNSVLLAGSAAQLGLAQRLLAQMDSGGREVPALRAFRLRYASAAKVAGALRELAAADKRLSGLRVRVDAEAGAVVVLAEPELMVRVERLVEDMDQPRPRVLVEALVLELPALAVGQGEVLAALPGPLGGASVLANPPPGSPAGASGFAQAAVGVGVGVRGQAPSIGPGVVPGAAAGVGNLTGQGGPDALAALAAQLAADPEMRVLARPRAAVPDGGDMSLSITRPGPGGAGAAQETARQRLVFTPLQDPENGQLSVRVRLEEPEESEGAARLQIAEALLPEGSLLLLVARGRGAGNAVPDSGQAGPKTGAGWTLSSHRQEDRTGSRRLCIVLAARVVRGGESAAGASRGLGEKKP